MHQTVTFPLEGINCGGCVARAEAAITGVEGVSAPIVNLATRTATVGGDSETLRNVSDALAQAGYPASVSEMVLDVDGMHCASCVGRVETALLAVPGALDANANLVTGQVRVRTLSTDSAPLVAAISAIGYRATLHANLSPAESNSEADDAQRSLQKFLLSAVLTLPVFVMEMGGHIFPPFHHWLAGTIGLGASWIIQAVLAGLVLAFPGRQFFSIGFKALARFAPDMNTLVALGSGAAFAYSMVVLVWPEMLPPEARAVYFEAAAVIVTLILLGRWLEARARKQTGDALRSLIGLRPDTALRLDGIEPVEVPVDTLVAGDRILIHPGARIPVDGVVISGESTADEAMLTGEPMPIAKAHGDPLTAGTVNGTGPLTMEARAVGSETVLARIVALVEAAQTTKLPIQDLVNKVAAWFVPAVLVIATLTVLGWLAFGPAPAAPFALVAGVSVLIIACPCAMGLAVPVSIIAGTGRAATQGILFRNGRAIQLLSSARNIAFDKTGTLTVGTPEMTKLTTFGTWNRDELLALVASVEARSEHSLAKSVLRAAQMAGVTLSEPDAIRALPGKGIEATVSGQSVLIGNTRFLTDAGVECEGVEAQVLVAVNGTLAGSMEFSDPVRAEAQEAIAALRDRGLGTALLSGDTQENATRVGRWLGIDTALGGLLPDEKQVKIGAFEGPVVFVGDGINDGPALASADVGIAIGSGTDIAMETADLVLMADDLRGIDRAIDLSERVMANIRQNLFWAFGYNVALIPVAAGLLYPTSGFLLSPPLAAGAMALSSVLVVFNALRLRWA